MFDYASNEWIETAKLTASDGDSSDLLGWSLALDGDLLAVGAKGWENSVSNAGAVYVFRHNGTGWNEEQILSAGADQQGSADFGTSVDVDGDAIIVGAPRYDVSGNANAGKAYIFRYDALMSTWVEEDDIIAGDVEAGARFGDFVSISGGRAAVGAPLADYTAGTPVSDTGGRVALLMLGATGRLVRQCFERGPGDRIGGTSSSYRCLQTAIDLLLEWHAMRTASGKRAAEQSIHVRRRLHCNSLRWNPVDHPSKWKGPSRRAQKRET